MKIVVFREENRLSDDTHDMLPCDKRLTHVGKSGRSRLSSVAGKGLEPILNHDARLQRTVASLEKAGPPPHRMHIMHTMPWSLSHNDVLGGDRIMLDIYAVVHRGRKNHSDVAGHRANPGIFRAQCNYDLRLL